MKYFEQGFTLIELLTVITIVGILTAVAIPEYQVYRAQSFDTRALSDLRNVAISEEAYFLDTERYISCENSDCEELPGIVAISNGTTLSITAQDTSFIGESQNEKGSGRIYRWDSRTGGLQ